MDTSGGGGDTPAPATTPAPMAIATGGGSGVVAPDAPLLFTNPTTEEEHRGIPEAVFFDDVPAVGAAHGAAPTIAALDQLLAKYKFWEERFQRRRAALSTKIPDVTRAVDVIQALQAAAEAQGGGANGDGGDGRAKTGAAADAAGADAAGGGGDTGTLETHFELSTQLFAKATVKAGRSVCLWLGASVMVEYELSDAMELLRENLAGAQSQLAEMEGDLAFLRSQMNVVEVNMTRVYNWDVAMRRQAAKAASGGGSAAAVVAAPGKGAIEAAPSAKA
ncbi:hypothetical protein BU14_0074s0017 [Porphyra umbilicalis]|uniref:Prefoldin subunit 3 n=1 Tax=Porphyra umbilicalis TaxID=2786 RepID=A0A1X6PFR3_PORUM|nr:hypothetical protein BU14_0074s0017 [Porphyra umbilicalis]|eukprot:OSX79586.1 hypothetical protein BU14_0074s0017 [Porphyra umbilicalis]